MTETKNVARAVKENTIVGADTLTRTTPRGTTRKMETGILVAVPRMRPKAAVVTIIIGTATTIRGLFRHRENQNDMIADFQLEAPGRLARPLGLLRSKLSIVEESLTSERKNAMHKRQTTTEKSGIVASGVNHDTKSQPRRKTER